MERFIKGNLSVRGSIMPDWLQNRRGIQRHRRPRLTMIDKRYRDVTWLDIRFHKELTKPAAFLAHDNVLDLVDRAVKPREAHNGVTGELRHRTVRFDPDGVRLPVNLVHLPSDVPTATTCRRLLL